MSAAAKNVRGLIVRIAVIIGSKNSYYFRSGEIDVIFDLLSQLLTSYVSVIHNVSLKLSSISFQIQFVLLPHSSCYSAAQLTDLATSNLAAGSGVGELQHPGVLNCLFFAIFECQNEVVERCYRVHEPDLVLNCIFWCGYPYNLPLSLQKTKRLLNDHTMPRMAEIIKLFCIGRLLIRIPEILKVIAN